DAINGIGNTADNVLTGNSAANVFTGGAGNDTYVLGLSDSVVELPGEGIDTVKSTVSFVLSDNVENLTLTGSDPTNGIGNAQDNIITGNTAPNTLAGMDGNDKLVGGAASDTLIGGRGNDVLQGGIGNDTYQFEREFGQDTIFENDATVGS